MINVLTVKEKTGKGEAKEKTGKGEGKVKAVVKAKSVELVDHGRQESL